jgi:hypothetical protein
MVYYLRSAKHNSSNGSHSVESNLSHSTSEVSESTPSSYESDKMIEKYYPAFLHALYALAITFLLCHILVRFFSPSFLCEKDKNGNVILGKKGYGYVDHKKAYLISGVVALISLVVSIMSVMKSDE